MQEDVVEVGCGGCEHILLAEGGGVDDEDDGLELLESPQLAPADLPQLPVAWRIDEEELGVRARCVVAVAEAGLGVRVGGSEELNGVGGLGRVRRGGCERPRGWGRRVVPSALLVECEEARFPGGGGAEKEDAGRDGVGVRRGENEVEEDWRADDDDDGDNEEREGWLEETLEYGC